LIRQRLTFDQLQDEAADSAGFFDAVDLRDVGMIQRRQRPRFAIEARKTLWIGPSRAPAPSSGISALIYRRISRRALAEFKRGTSSSTGFLFINVVSAFRRTCGCAGLKPDPTSYDSGPSVWR
jgi:hypothetical protein